MIFYDILQKLCNEQGIKVTPLLMELGLSKGNISKWKNGTLPNGEILLKIADYFNCSTDYLLGRTETPQGYSNNNIVHSDHVAFGEGAQVNIESSDNMKNEILIEIAKMIDEMTLQEKGRFIDYLYKFEK